MNFLEGLAELGIDKGGIKNNEKNEKKITEITKILSNESSVESSSNREEEGEKLASVNVGEAGDTQESDNDTENDSQERESSSPETSTFHSENPCEHIVRILMCTGH